MQTTPWLARWKPSPSISVTTPLLSVVKHQTERMVKTAYTAVYAIEISASGKLAVLAHASGGYGFLVVNISVPQNPTLLRRFGE